MMFSPEGSNAFYLGLALNQWSRVCLPIFVFVSGFALFYVYGKGTKVDYKIFYGKRLQSVILPYALWSFIYLILRNIFNKTYEFFSLPLKDLIVEYFKWTLWENIHITLWFVLMITQLYLLFPLFRRAILRIKRPTLAVLMHTLIYFILTTYLVHFRRDTGIALIDFIQNHYKVNFLGWYYYFFLGGMAALGWNRLKEIQWNHWALFGSYVLAALLVLLEAYRGFLLYGRAHLESYISLRPTVMINSLLALPTFYLLGKSFMSSPGVSRWISKVSRYSYGIYFVHPQVLTILKILMGRALGTYTARMSYLAVLFSLTFIFSFAFCYIVDKTPWRRILLGVS